MTAPEPTREEVDALPGPTVLEFGASWCGHCHAARPVVDPLLASRSNVRHLQIEDGPGRRLGRSFRVKLWPTFIFLLDGREVARVVRPRDPGDVAPGFARLDAG